MSVIKQFSWNPDTKTGSFSENMKNPEASLTLKLELHEVGGLIDLIERNRPVNSVHVIKTTGQSTGFNFTPYMRTDSAGVSKQVGFSFSINRQLQDQKSSYLIGINFAEARLLKEYLVSFLHRYFENLDRADVQKRSEYRSNQTARPQTVTKAPVQEQAPPEPDFEPPTGPDETDLDQP